MTKMTFLEDTIFESEGRNKGPRYEKGKTYDIPEDKVERWKRRGVAIEAGEKAKATEAQAVGVTAPPAPPIEIPDGWEAMYADEMKDLAHQLGAGDDVTTKAQATEFIQAEVAKRARG